jgi:hypothetical protein
MRGGRQAAPVPGAEGKPGYSCVSDDTRGNRQPEGLGLPIELAEENASLGADRPGLRIDPRGLGGFPHVRLSWLYLSSNILLVLSA